MPGTLYVVATPIGNLEDLTFRAKRVLDEVDLIAAEDTRRTARLLARYDIRTSVNSFHAHNEARQTTRLLALLERGRSVALVSDAGTPGISDPGPRLVASAHRAGVRVVPVPGPSAVAAALSASGFPGHQFVFMGFPPASGGARRRWFEEVSREPRTVVLFEAPHRIRKTIDELASLVNRPIMVSRELTKVHERLVISPNMESLPPVDRRGELTVVLGPVDRSPVTPSESEVYVLFSRLTEKAGFDRDEALNLVALAFGTGKREVAKLVKKAKILVKRQKEGSP